MTNSTASIHRDIDPHFISAFISANDEEKAVTLAKEPRGKKQTFSRGGEARNSTRKLPTHGDAWILASAMPSVLNPSRVRTVPGTGLA